MILMLSLVSDGTIHELHPGRQFRQQHFPALTPLDQSRSLIAMVTTSPTDPSIIGLTNLSTIDWTASLPSGYSRLVETGKTIKLVPGSQINMGPYIVSVVVSTTPQASRNSYQPSTNMNSSQRGYFAKSPNSSPEPADQKPEQVIDEILGVIKFLFPVSLAAGIVGMLLIFGIGQLLHPLDHDKGNPQNRNEGQPSLSTPASDGS